MKSAFVPSSTGNAQHTFARAPSVGLPRSVFNRSHGVKTTFDAGYLVPILIDEMLPGDTFNLNFTGLVRMATPLYPLMDNLYFETFFFVVPNRLLWVNWEKFCGAQDNPGDSTSFVVPTVTFPASIGSYTLQDYFGLPIGLSTAMTVNALPFRMYNFIWNEWFRDQNLQDSVLWGSDDGPDNASNYVLLQRGKRYDYFTSCLPWPQKGPDVLLPLGTSAPIVSDTSSPVLYGPTSSTWGPLTTNGGNNPSILMSSIAVPGGNVTWGPAGTATTGLQADLSSATAASINDLRQAFQIQRMYEKDARGGTRFTEVLKNHFHVTSEDYRLQRPEYVGGGSSPVIINPVTQTAPKSGTSTDLGDLAAYGLATPHGHGFVYSAKEHCYVLGLACVRADLNYQQGLNRLWSRSTRFDFYWPTLAHLGEQAVLNQEIFMQGNSADLEVFGYQERYAEYRFKPSSITGVFRSAAGGTLDAWHLAQDFATLPALNSEFIVENPPVDRVIAVPSEPQFLLDGFFAYKCARPMPTYSIPGLIDHF